MENQTKFLIEGVPAKLCYANGKGFWRVEVYNDDGDVLYISSNFLHKQEAIKEATAWVKICLRLLEKMEKTE